MKITSKQSIAVIGSGMAGLAAARLMKDAGHDVTVFEAQTAHGMDSHTVFLHGGIVDVPLRVMSPLIWKNTLSLAKHVGVETFKVNTFISCNWLDGTTWFRSDRHRRTNLPLLGSWRYLNKNTAIIVKEIVRLLLATHRLKRQNDTQMTLGQFLEQNQFHPLFWRGIVLPVLTTICTCQEHYLMEWPALRLLNITEKIMHGEQLVRLQGGTPALVKALGHNLKFVSGSPVTALEQTADGVKVQNERGDGGLFDQVIVATPTNQLNFIDQQQFSRELALMRQFMFDRGELWVHEDTRFMPKEQQDWTALNYHIQPDLKASMFTVWVNAVEPTLDNTPAVFQTWNPLFEPDPALTISRTPLFRAVVHQGNQQALVELEKLHQESDRRVYFCGSWASAGIPLLESAVQSAIRVAKHMNVSPTFKISDIGA